MNELEKYIAKKKLASALMEKEAFVGTAIRLGKAAVQNAPKLVGLAKNLPTRIRRLSPKFRAKQDQQMMSLRGGSGRFKPENPAELARVRSYIAAGGQKTVSPEKVQSFMRMKSLGRNNAKVLLPRTLKKPGQRIPLGKNLGAQGTADYTSAIGATRSNTFRNLSKAMSTQAGKNIKPTVLK